VEISAELASAAWPQLARVALVEIDMVLLLLPPMAFAATELEATAIAVSFKEGFLGPLLAGLSGVPVLGRRTTIILPIVGEDAVLLVVFAVTERTPYSFEVEKEEVVIPFEQIDAVHSQFLIRVGKATEFTEITAGIGRVKRLAKFGLVLLRVEELFSASMAIRTVVAFPAVPFRFEELARDRLIRTQLPPSISEGIVVERTLLIVVGTRVTFARENFESRKVKEPHKGCVLEKGLNEGGELLSIPRFFLCVDPRGQLVGVKHPEVGRLKLSEARFGPIEGRLILPKYDI